MLTYWLAPLALALTVVGAPAVASAYDDSALSRSKRLTHFERAYNKGFEDGASSGGASAQAAGPAAPSAALAAAPAGAAAPAAPGTEVGASAAQTGGADPLSYDPTPAQPFPGKEHPGLGPIVYLGDEEKAEVEPNPAVTANKEAIKNIEASEERLEQAKVTLEESIRLQQEAVQQAQAELELAKTKAAAQIEAQRLDSNTVKSSLVSGHFEGKTLQEIASSIMPEGWTVRVHGADDSIELRRFEYVADSIARDKALHELTAPLGLRFKYFFGLTDADGKSTPMLLIFDPRASLTKGS